MRRWLKSSIIGVLSLVTFAGCALPGGQPSTGNSAINSAQENEGYYNVHFELCTDKKTNMIDDQEVEEGDVVIKPSVGIIGDNSERLEIEGWYRDAEYTQPWNFILDTVEENMTLYAKWVKKFEVTYYLGEEVDVPMYKQYVKEGELLTGYEALSDGYESDGFFTNARFTEKFDFTKPITSDINVYIHRSKHFYFSGKMIAERFKMMEATSGEGSTPGTIEYKEDAETGEGYASINFGYSTAADPHALLSGVTVDISASQKVEVTFRNLGEARSLKFYYVLWMPDGTTTDGASFNENNAFIYTYQPSEKNMSEDDEWITKTFDFASVLNNGVSNWGISATMISLRIQSGYISKNEEDLSNVVQIKSIKGIPDDTYTSTEDKEDVAALRVDDDATKVKEVADAQEDVCGWVFPKDYSTAVANNSEIYEKTDGLLFYSPFRQKNAGVSFNLATDENGVKERISLDEKTTIRIRLTNYGYSNKLGLEYKNSYGFIKSKSLAIAPCSGEPEMKEYVLNMFGEDRYEGTLASLGFLYDSVGINNAIVIHSVEFLDFKMIDIPGVNFNNKYVGTTEKDPFWTTASGVEMAHNGGTLLDGGTVFNATANGYVERNCSITNLGYESMTLKFKDVETVRNVMVGLTIGGVTAEYNFDLTAEEVQTVNGWSLLILPFTANGQIEKVKLSFLGGEGTVTIQELRFNMPKHSGLDFSDPSVSGTIITNLWDGGVIAYDNSTSAALLSANYNVTTGEAGTVRYYYDALLKAHNIGEGNIDISEKSKIVIIYNNTGSVSGLDVGLGLVDVTEGEEWKTSHTEIGSPNSGGMVANRAIKTNMAYGEWAALEIDLSSFATLGDGTEGRAISEIGFRQANKESKENVYIRAIIIL